MSPLDPVRAELSACRAAIARGPSFGDRRRLGATLTELRQRCRAQGVEARGLRAELSELESELEARNRAEVDGLVDAIAAGRLRGEALMEALATHSSHPLDEGSPHFGDEPLDHLLESLLDTNGRFDGGPSPGDEMIHYDPSPASATLALARLGWLAPSEVFVDIGSGTGRVSILAALLGEARCVGVEIDEALVAVAERASRRLGAENLELRVGDARTAPLEDGTAFFFFAPFLGTVLDDVLGRLEAISRTRRIRVGSWGPSTPRIAEAGFLRADRVLPYGPFDLATFRSASEPAE